LSCSSPLWRPPTRKGTTRPTRPWTSLLPSVHAACHGSAKSPPILLPPLRCSRLIRRQRNRHQRQRPRRWRSRRIRCSNGAHRLRTARRPCAEMSGRHGCSD